MVEKTIQQTNSDQMRERFHFVLTSNGNIVCKRYFKIHGFKNESESSTQLVGHSYHLREDGVYEYFEGALERSARMIHESLVRKSNTYLWNSAPQVFNSLEEMNNYIMSGKCKLDVAQYIIFRDSDDVYVWTGEKAEPYFVGGKSVYPYTNTFNRSDYINDNEQKNVLKLAFYDDDKEICSKEWDANVYPRFVRNNIDITNSKNKYKVDGQYQIVEATLIDMMNEGEKDLIPAIIYDFCTSCSYSDKSDYVQTAEFGDKEYDLNIGRANQNVIRSYERSVKKKTEKYFKNLY